MLSDEAREALTELFPTIMQIKDVARELKVTELTVRRMIWDGELDAYMIGIEWQINRSSVIAALSRRSNL
jgi:excisionase family DNA binding protein